MSYLDPYRLLAPRFPSAFTFTDFGERISDLILVLGREDDLLLWCGGASLSSLTIEDGKGGSRRPPRTFSTWSRLL